MRTPPRRVLLDALPSYEVEVAIDDGSVVVTVTVGCEADRPAVEKVLSGYALRSTVRVRPGAEAVHTGP